MVRDFLAGQKTIAAINLDPVFYRSEEQDKTRVVTQSVSDIPPLCIPPQDKIKTPIIHPAFYPLSKGSIDESKARKKSLPVPDITVRDPDTLPYLYYREC